MNAFMGSEWEQEAWNSCLAMLHELDDAFPYLPLPNYLWVHTTASVLWVMRREREVYMQGIESAPLEDEDIDMGVISEEEAVPERLIGGQVPEQRGFVPLETELPLVEAPSESVRNERVPPKVTRTYSKKSSAVVASGTVDSTVSPTTPKQRRVILTVSEPILPQRSASLVMPPSPLPSGGDNSLDKDYLGEWPLQIWVNATCLCRRLHLDRQRLDDGAVRERPVHPADTALVRVVNLHACARGQAPRITWGVGVRASDILFVSVVLGFQDYWLTWPLVGLRELCFLYQTRAPLHLCCRGARVSYVLPSEDDVSGAGGLSFDMGAGPSYQGSYWPSVGLGDQSLRHYGFL